MIGRTFAGIRREEDLKLRERALENLKIKGAFGAQELYDKHRGEKIACYLCIGELPAQFYSACSADHLGL